MALWIQRIAWAAAIVPALAACAADSTTQDVTVPTVTSQVSSSTTGVAGGAETSTLITAVASDPSLQVDGPAAPDFTFALADGSSFSLSDEQKPVYLVFWAEW